MNKFLLSIARNKLVRGIILCIPRCNIVRKRKIKNYLKSTETAKLQIGYGGNKLDGWLNTGISIKEGWNGVYLDAAKTFPLPDDSFEYVYSEHLFEHLTYNQGVNLLKESYRILKPGGVIRIATPDLKFLLGLYKEPEKPIHQSYLNYSVSKSNIPASPVYVINQFHTSWGHQIIYDKETLGQLMADIGFKDIKSCEVGESDHEPLQNIEAHFKIFTKEFNELETMILEGTK